MLKIVQFIMIVVVSSTILACATSSMQESPAEYLSSSAVTAKVKTNLVDQLGANGLNIQVKTYKDEVQLSGFVNSTVIKQRAGRIAINTLDVKRVTNNLIVKTN
jgi:osmotically-inducible protein OsmY